MDKTVFSRIDPERLYQTFAELVCIDAESHHERAMADVVTAKLRSLGLSVTEDRANEQIPDKNGVPSPDGAGNLYCLLPGTGPGEPVLFGSHLDTVSPGIGKQPLLQPDGTIVSKGATVLGADDAAAMAEVLEALTVIREQNIPHPDLELVINTSEESYAEGSKHFDYSCVKSRRAYVFDMSGPVGGVAVAAPTLLSFQVCVKGKSAHAGFQPEAGIHAIKIAAESLSVLPVGWVDDETTVNFGLISGGTGRNIVPAEVTVGGEIRSMSDEKAHAQLRQIEEQFREVAERYGGSVTMEWEQHLKAYRIASNEPVLQRFRAAAKLIGLPVQEQDTFGGSDNNNHVEHGIRGVVPACGMNKTHTVDEYTTLSELTRAAKLTLALMILPEGES